MQWDYLLNDQLSRGKTEGMTNPEITTFLMCPAPNADALGGTPSANDAGRGHIRKVAGWAHVFDAASVALVRVLVRGPQLLPANHSHQASDSEQDGLFPCEIAAEEQLKRLQAEIDRSKGAADKESEGNEVLAHGGSSGLGFGDEKFGEMLASQSGENTISDAIGQHVGPLSHSRGGDSDSFGGGCDRAPKQFDGASFKHDGAKVSTLTATPQVRLPLAGF